MYKNLLFRQHSRRCVIVGLLLLACVSMFPSRALADSAYGTYSSWTCGSSTMYTYSGRSNASASSSIVMASQEVYRPGYTVPKGQVGALPRLYSSNGLLRQSGGWRYTDSVLPAGQRQIFSTSIFDGIVISSKWYSHGYSAGWDGAGMSTYLTPKSPNVIAFG